MAAVEPSRVPSDTGIEIGGFGVGEAALSLERLDGVTTPAATSANDVRLGGGVGGRVAGHGASVQKSERSGLRSIRRP
jgi:hypothetical protein